MLTRMCNRCKATVPYPRSYCDKCQPVVDMQQAKDLAVRQSRRIRPDYTNWYKDRNYLRRRASYLAEHPWCVRCQVEGKPFVAATELDHIIPFKGNRTLFLDWNNWQGLCAHHHGMKSMTEDR